MVAVRALSAPARAIAAGAVDQDAPAGVGADRRTVHADTVANARGDGVGNAGVRKLPLVTRHILPGTPPGVIVYPSLRMGTSILTAAAHSFIGLGA